LAPFLQTWASASFTVLALPTPTPEPTVCDPTGAPGEVVIDFEDVTCDTLLRDLTLPGDIIIRYEDAMAISSPLAHSAGTALINYPAAVEFGSAGAPLEIELLNVQDFVGVFVGVQGDEGHTFTATLTAYGRNESGGLVVLGADSVELGPNSLPIEECLAVEAPGQIIKISLDYGPDATVGEPEFIDDLVLRGPEEPVPVPEDDVPPIVHITSPEEGALVTDDPVSYEGDIIEAHALARVEGWLEGSVMHEIAAARIGLEQYWFRDYFETGGMLWCGDNQIEVRAYDEAENQGSDSVRFNFVGSGDLSIVSVEPVQVLYDVPLVMNKNTAFRVVFESTFYCEAETYFELVLPEDQWRVEVPSGDVPYPDIWGPVPIPRGRSEITVMLPYIPQSQVTAEYDPVSNPAGMASRVGFTPDIRVVPRPIASEVSFSVVIDPENLLAEIDEGNNRADSAVYPVVSTGPWRFLAFQTTGGERAPGCTPAYEAVYTKFESNLEYILGTFPIPDDKILGVLSSWPQTYDTTVEGRDVFLARMANLAARFGYDFGVGITCDDGGAWGSIQAVVIGAHTGGIELMAHEFNHAVVPMDDIYTLDCYCAWDDRYCELADGNRFYCCFGFPISEAHRDGREEMGVDPMLGCTIDCGSDLAVCDQACCWDLCEAECDEQGGTTYGCPDQRPGVDVPLPGGDGFWVNAWRPEEGKTYFMDGPTGDNWISSDSIVAEGRVYCPGNYGVESDGYLNLLENERFAVEVDPEVLLVSGVVFLDGRAELDPFVVLPEGRLDLEPGSEGDYHIVLLDGAGGVLSQTGFDLHFFMSDPNGGPTDHTPFVFRLLWVEGTQQIELRDGQGAVLISRHVSATAPTVEITSPEGGVFNAGQAVTVRWLGEDADGDQLFYSLAVSEDAGVTWQPVALDLTQESYTLDASGFAPGGAYIVKVIASDGVLSSSTVSDFFNISLDAGPALPSWLAPFGIGAAVAVVAVLIVLVVILRRRRKRG
jgi:hypothetical protein